jgi:hypothetical protein
MSIACGVCKGRHDNIDAARACSARYNAARFGSAALTPVVTTQTAPRRPAASSFAELASRFHLPEDGSPLRYAYRLHADDERAQMFQARKDAKTGRIYVDGISSHSDAKVKIEGREAYRHLARTVEHQAEALALYGQVTNRCTKCHRKLVREPWVSLGYGEDCAKWVEGA